MHKYVYSKFCYTSELPKYYNASLSWTSKKIQSPPPFYFLPGPLSITNDRSLTISHFNLLLQSCSAQTCSNVFIGRGDSDLYKFNKNVDLSDLVNPPEWGFTVQIEETFFSIFSITSNRNDTIQIQFVFISIQMQGPRKDLYSRNKSLTHERGKKGGKLMSNHIKRENCWLAKIKYKIQYKKKYNNE